MKEMNSTPLTLLRQPFPLNLPGAAAVRLRLGIALLVYFILIVFQPFGLSTRPHNYMALDLAGYGVITFVVLSFFETVVQRMFPTVFNEEKWTVGKAILWLWIIIFVIGLCNTAYFWILCLNTEDSRGAGIMLFYTSVVGIFPFALGIIGRFTILYHRYKQRAEELSLLNIHEKNRDEAEEDYAIALFQDNKKSKVLLQAKQILLIESAENYINIYSQAGAELKKMMIRCTLQYAEESTQTTPMLVRCHRSYIVNLAAVSKLFGNAQGYKLQIISIEKPVPVSRKYEKAVVERLKRIKNNAVLSDSDIIHSPQRTINSALS